MKTQFGSNLKKLREKRGLSQEELGEIVNVSDKTVSSWEINRTEPKMGVVQTLADYFKVSTDCLIGVEENDEIFQKVIQIPLYSSISCGLGLFVDENIDDYISVPNKIIKRGHEYFANYAQGDSMINKGISDGDVLVFERTNVLENGQIGSFCIDNETNVCKIYRKLNNGMILLESANENYSPIEIDITDGTCFRVIGKLVGSFKQY